MTRVTAGKVPWNAEADKERLSKFQEGYKRLNKTQRGQLGLEHSLTSGYRQQKPWHWLFEGSEQKKMAEITSSTGKKYKVSYQDYNDYIGFDNYKQQLGIGDIRNPDATSREKNMADYVENANYTRVWPRDEDTISPTGVMGHISEIKYDYNRTLMLVEFGGTSYVNKDGKTSTNNGASVVYFRVPKEVYYRLEKTARDGGTYTDSRGVTRHLLGKVFWESVRILGQKRGGRYEYRYTSSGGSVRKYINNMVNDITKEMGDEHFSEEEWTAGGLDRIAENYFAGMPPDDADVQALKRDYRKLSPDDKYKFIQSIGRLN
jgi:hypothetical protein